jgi:hypothetical protein
MLLYNYPTRSSLFLSKCPRFLRRWLKKRRPATFIVNTDRMLLPHVLEAGRNWHGMAIHTPELAQMIKGGRLFVGVVGSRSNKPIFPPGADLDTAEGACR